MCIIYVYKCETARPTVLPNKLNTFLVRSSPTLPPIFSYHEKLSVHYTHRGEILTGMCIFQPIVFAVINTSASSYTRPRTDHGVPRYSRVVTGQRI